MNKIIKTGLAGFGLSGKVFHAPFITFNPAYQLCSVLERSRSEAKKSYPGVKIARSMDELLEDSDIELVVITTPNTTHADYARKALAKGKHVLLEKPFTISSVEADSLIKLANEKKKILTVYHNRRYDGDYMTIRKIIDESLLGKIVEYESHFDRYRLTSPFKGGWRGEKLPGSGVLYDLGSHLIDQALVLFGTPQSIWAHLNYDHSESKVDDGFLLFLNYKQLRVILRAGTIVKNPGPRFTLHGTNGSYIKYGLDVQEADLKKGKFPGSDDWGREPEVNYGAINTSLNGNNINGRIETISGNYNHFYTSLADAIVNNKKPPVTANEAKAVIKIIELAMQSYNEKRTIDY